MLDFIGFMQPCSSESTAPLLIILRLPEGCIFVPLPIISLFYMYVGLLGYSRPTVLWPSA